MKLFAFILAPHTLECQKTLVFSQNLPDYKLRIITKPNLNNILNLGEEIAPTQTEETTRTRKFPPGTFINIGTIHILRKHLKGGRGLENGNFLIFSTKNIIM